MRDATENSSHVDVHTTSGLQLLEALLAGRIERSSIAHTMPMQLTSVEQGEVRMTVTPDARHLNPAGMVHGGFAATCLDGAAALALLSVLDADTAYATVDLNVKYVRPLAASVDYLATGRVLEKTRSLGVCTAEIRGQDGKLHAVASATLTIKPA